MIATIAKKMKVKMNEKTLIKQRLAYAISQIQHRALGTCNFLFPLPEPDSTVFCLSKICLTLYFKPSYGHFRPTRRTFHPAIDLPVLIRVMSWRLVV